ncbi:unnamed protein product [Chrysoparadoxa australica]
MQSLLWIAAILLAGSLIPSSPTFAAALTPEGGDHEMDAERMMTDVIDDTGGYVCGIHDGNYVSYPSYEAAVGDNANVVQCGKCGQCSTDHDIGIMRATRETLTGTATRCAVTYALAGARVSSNCMRRLVGFSPPCQQCWDENIRCTYEACRRICFRWKTRPWTFPPLPEGALDPCLQCDEDVCGPAFKACSGATRRRLGVISDINRADSEICPYV